MNNNYKKDNLYLAELRWFCEGKGIEFDLPLSYVILNKNGNQYSNVFDIYENYPVFKRSNCYSNCTSEGVEFGSKMIYKSGILEEGPCWVIDSSLPVNKDEVSLDDLKNFVMQDSRYFKDRRDFAKKKERNVFKLMRLLFKDNLDYDYMNNYIESREKQKVKKI